VLANGGHLLQSLASQMPQALERMRMAPALDGSGR
jgi:hypothetical protein